MLRVLTSRAGHIMWTLAVFGLISTACSGHATCPNRQRLTTGEACHGDDLQCPYDVKVAECDGGTSTVESSCNCLDGVWSCPVLSPPVCPKLSH